MKHTQVSKAMPDSTCSKNDDS
ncbi:hypothetical protein ZEAMMB73_Zm00001d020149 [Zea mays]|uniref:Uncharacterized protein n=1 Tax=Zea mays TaxID=4577 RepID=A0A1D6I2D6_MAIZE|nr:hypothetical protein ZEAMMB73_Zm00001d020149 [Zea mays]